MIDVNANVRRLCDTLRSMGLTEDECPKGFATDVNSGILGDPYLEGTGYFYTREEAEDVATLAIRIVALLAGDAVRQNPGDWPWVDPASEARSPWAYIVSAERDNQYEPVVEDIFYDPGRVVDVDALATEVCGKDAHAVWTLSVLLEELQKDLDNAEQRA